jgi:hypothetical protein
MSDDKPKADHVPHRYIQAEGTLSGADDAQIYLDIAETLLSQTTHPLEVVIVQRWPRDGHTIVWVRADQDATGTRAKKALATQIEEWEPVIEEPAT